MENFVNPCVIQTIIICFTVIALTVIGVSAYMVSKRQKSNWGSYIFMASILLMIAIGIFSWTFYGNEAVLDFLSLASALISIILAVITIIYSFYSNSRLTGQIETLNNAAQGVKDATSSYSGTAESLQRNILKIIEAVNRVEQKTDSLIDGAFKVNMGKITDQINELKGITETAKEIDKKSKVDNNFDVLKYVRTYLEMASPVGLIAMYACIRSKDTEKLLNVRLLHTAYEQAYCCGFLTSIHCSGLISSQIDYATGNIMVSAYVPFVKDYINSWIGKYDFKQVPGLWDWKQSIDTFFDAK